MAVHNLIYSECMYIWCCWCKCICCLHAFEDHKDRWYHGNYHDHNVSSADSWKLGSVVQAIQRRKWSVDGFAYNWHSKKVIKAAWTVNYLFAWQFQRMLSQLLHTKSSYRTHHKWYKLFVVRGIEYLYFGPDTVCICSVITFGHPAIVCFLMGLPPTFLLFTISPRSHTHHYWPHMVN